MTVRLYVDEDALDKDLGRALRARGVDDMVIALEAPPQLRNPQFAVRNSND